MNRKRFTRHVSGPSEAIGVTCALTQTFNLSSTSGSCRICRTSSLQLSSSFTSFEPYPVASFQLDLILFLQLASLLLCDTPPLSTVVSPRTGRDNQLAQQLILALPLYSRSWRRSTTTTTNSLTDTFLPEIPSPVGPSFSSKAFVSHVCSTLSNNQRQQQQQLDSSSRSSL